MKNPNVITKYYQKEDINSKAVYSSCEKYRYSLTRIWNKKAEKLHFVMLNPLRRQKFKTTRQLNDVNEERVL